MTTREQRRYLFTHLPFWHVLKIRDVVEEEIRRGLLIRPVFGDGSARWDCRAALAAMRVILSERGWPSLHRYECAIYLEEMQEQIVRGDLPPLASCRRGDLIQEGNVG